jgi:hypothetical protein
MGPVIYKAVIGGLLFLLMVSFILLSLFFTLFFKPAICTSDLIGELFIRLLLELTLMVTF